MGVAKEKLLQVEFSHADIMELEQHREELGRRGQCATHWREREGDWNAQGTGILWGNIFYACLLH